MAKGVKISLCALLILEVITFVAMSCFFIVTRESAQYLYKNIADVPQAQTAVILGAGVLPNGQLSGVLQDRVDAAIRLYQAGKVQKILVTGDNSTLSHNEVNPMRNYLVKAGIPDANIFLDHAGFDTYSSIYRAHDIFEVSSAIIVTQSFHLPRAVYIGREIGMESYGFSADNGHYLFSNYAHEWFADIKAVLDLITHRAPKYLGDHFPITGDGTSTQ